MEEIWRLSERGNSLYKHKLKRLMEEESFRLDHRALFDLLTLREKEVLRLVALGQTNQEISKELFVSIDTVRTHRNRIWQKLEIKNLAQAIKFAMAFDLV